MCQGTLRPSSGVMVDWMSALVSLEISISSTWVTVASRVEDSTYLVFIWARMRYSVKRSRRATAYGRSIKTSGAGVAEGGTVDRQMLPFLMPTLAEKMALMACCTISSGMTFHASRAVALALCAPSICAMSAQAMIFLDSQASTKERIMLMLR